MPLSSPSCKAPRDRSYHVPSFPVTRRTVVAPCVFARQVRHRKRLRHLDRCVDSEVATVAAHLNILDGSGQLRIHRGIGGPNTPHPVRTGEDPVSSDLVRSAVQSHNSMVEFRCQLLEVQAVLSSW